MEDVNRTVLYYENMEGGHGDIANSEQAVFYECVGLHIFVGNLTGEMTIPQVKQTAPTILSTPKIQLRVRNKPMQKTIIFDLDGTLADSVGCIVETVHIVEDALAISRVSDAAIRGMIGRPLTAIFTELHALDGEMLQRAIDIYKRDYVRMTGIHERLFEGGIELLTTLRSHGFQLAIATGKDQVGAENACARLGLTPYFDSIHGILPGTPGKPHPAILHRVMESLDSSPESKLDRRHNPRLQLARAANIAAVGVNWGVHSEAELVEYGVQVATNMSDCWRLCWTWHDLEYHCT